MGVMICDFPNLLSHEVKGDLKLNKSFFLVSLSVLLPPVMLSHITLNSSNSFTTD